MKIVQLFTVRPEKYDDNCEVNAELIGYSLGNGCLELNTKDEDGGLWEHVFPLHNVAMMRIFSDKKAKKNSRSDGNMSPVQY